MTGAGTSRAIASRTVQRPSPESATQPRMSGSSLPCCSKASPASSSSHDRMTVPCCQAVGDGGQVRAVLRGVEDLEPLRVRLHQAVLDAVVDHLGEVAGARGTGMDVAAFRRQGPEDGLQRGRPPATSPPTIVP